jgi:hypothetical protein
MKEIKDERESKREGREWGREAIFHTLEEPTNKDVNSPPN